MSWLHHVRNEVNVKESIHEMVEQHRLGCMEAYSEWAMSDGLEGYSNIIHLIARKEASLEELGNRMWTVSYTHLTN